MKDLVAFSTAVPLPAIPHSADTVVMGTTATTYSSAYVCDSSAPIDFVLTYKRRRHRRRRKSSAVVSTSLNQSDWNQSEYEEDTVKYRRRKIFLHNLVSNGLMLEKVSDTQTVVEYL